MSLQVPKTWKVWFHVVDALHTKKIWFCFDDWALHFAQDIFIYSCTGKYVELVQVYWFKIWGFHNGKRSDCGHRFVALYNVARWVPVFQIWLWHLMIEALFHQNTNIYLQEYTVSLSKHMCFCVNILFTLNYF